MTNVQSNSNRADHEEPEAEPLAQPPEESQPDVDEFKITVKKLDTVVRPRGVLADG
jgi:hypothetical protein